MGDYESYSRTIGLVLEAHPERPNYFGSGKNYRVFVYELAKPINCSADNTYTYEVGEMVKVYIERGSGEAAVRIFDGFQQKF